MRWLFVLLPAVGCAHPGTCETDDGLCYQHGESRHRCTRLATGQPGAFHWTDEGICTERGYPFLCRDEGGFEVYGETEDDCAWFNGETTPSGT